MLLKTYWVVGGLICLWFGYAALAGWRAPSFGAGVGSGSRSGGYYYIPGGGRSSSGSGGWGGGK